MACHLAILLKPYVDMVLDGRKTMESRLTRHPLPPFRCIEPGERIYIKISGGPIAATALAGEVRFFEGMTPRDVQAIRRDHNDGIRGDAGYWQRKKWSRYATLVHLRDVQPASDGPRVRSQGMAWFVLDESAVPPPPPRGFAITLTDAACRNRYVRPPHDFAHDGPFDLILPDGQSVRTELTRGMIRWRGWGPYFQQAAVRRGHRLWLEPTGPAQFRVRFEQPGDQP